MHISMQIYTGDASGTVKFWERGYADFEWRCSKTVANKELEVRFAEITVHQ